MNGSQGRCTVGHPLAMTARRLLAAGCAGLALPAQMRLRVAPDWITAGPGQSCLLAVELWDGERPLPAEVDWSVAAGGWDRPDGPWRDHGGAGGARIGADGVFTAPPEPAARDRFYRITATSRVRAEVRADAYVLVPEPIPGVPAAGKIRLDPAEATLWAGTAQLFRVQTDLDPFLPADLSWDWRCDAPPEARLRGMPGRPCALFVAPSVDRERVFTVRALARQGMRTYQARARVRVRPGRLNPESLQPSIMVGPAFSASAPAAGARVRADSARGNLLVTGLGQPAQVVGPAPAGIRRRVLTVSRRGSSEVIDLAPGPYVHVFAAEDQRVQVESSGPGLEDRSEQIELLVRGLWRFSGQERDLRGHRDGPWLLARYRRPFGVAALPGTSGRCPWLVADAGSHVVRLVDPDGGATTPWGAPDQPGCRDGQGDEARLRAPTYLALAPAKDGAPDWTGAALADSGNHVIRRLGPDGGVHLLAGIPEHAGFQDSGQDGQAAFSSPQGLAYDPAGNLYVADQGNRRIRRIALDGSVTTVAGTGAEGAQDGPGPEASFTRLKGLAMDARGHLFVADGHAVRRLEPDRGFRVTTVLGAVGELGRGFRDDVLDPEEGARLVPDKAMRAARLAGSALLDDPHGLHAVGARLFIADTGNDALREFDLVRGNLRTVAGGPGQRGNRDGLLRDTAEVFLDDTYGTLARPLGLAGDRRQDLLATAGPALVRAARAEGQHGAGENLPIPVEAAVDGCGQARNLTVRIRSEDLRARLRDAVEGASISTRLIPDRSAPLAPSPGAARVEPGGYAWDYPLPDGPGGKVLVRVLTPSGVTFGGSAVWRSPAPAAPDPGPDFPQALRRQARRQGPSRDEDLGQVVPVGVPGFLRWTAQPGAARQLFACRSRGTFREGGQLQGLEVTGSAYGPLRFPPSLREFRLDAFLPPPPGQEGDWTGWTKVRTYCRIHRRGVLVYAPLQSGASLGAAAAPEGWGGADAGILVADPERHVVREWFRHGEWPGRVWGRDGQAGAEDGAGGRLRAPTWVAAWTDPGSRRQLVAVADSGNHAIRLLHPDGSLGTLAGEPGVPGWRDSSARGPARFRHPAGLAFDPQGRRWVADAGNRRIRRIDPDGRVTTVAGSGAEGCQDGPGDQATFLHPKGLAVDGAGRVYVADGHAVRRVEPSGQVAVVAGHPLQRGAGESTLAAPAGLPCLARPLGLAWDGHALCIADRDNHCVRRFDPATGRLDILAGDAAAPAFRRGLLRDGLPGPLPPECATLAEPAGLCAHGNGDLVAVCPQRLVELARARGLAAPGPCAPIPLTLTPSFRMVLPVSGAGTDCRPYELTWDMDDLRRRSGDPGEGFRDARFLVESRTADGATDFQAADTLPVLGGKVSLPVIFSGPGPRTVRLTLRTAQGVLHGGETRVEVP